jgi:hypothetical protein
MSRYYINFQNGDQLAKDDEALSCRALKRLGKRHSFLPAKSSRTKSKPTPKTRCGLSSSLARTVRTF